MISAAQWSGDMDGRLVVDHEDGNFEIDRPGDLVFRMMNEECDSQLQAALLMYGYCLATQGMHLPHLVRSVLRKTGPFVRSVSMDSMHLYRAIEHFDKFVGDCPEEGDELRGRVLQEVTRYHLQSLSSNAS